MEKELKGKLTPLIPPMNGIWLPPEQAAPLFKNGRGIKLRTLMKKIYSGKLNGFVKRDHLGWSVFVPNRTLIEHTPLKAV